MFYFENEKTQDLGFIEGVFTPEECDKIVNYGNNLPTEKAGIGSLNIEQQDKRATTISWIMPTNEIGWLYNKLASIILDVNKEAFNFHLYGFTEMLQFTTYNAPGDHYVFHTDKIFNGPIRKLSFTLQLTDPINYEGGDLVYKIQEEDQIVPKTQGTLCIFPSYTLHKVTPVTKGKRQSLVGWLGGPNFK
jgi:PKHD-type hydroxylase